MISENLTYTPPSFIKDASLEQKSFFFYENIERFAYDILKETEYGGLDRPRMRRIAASAAAGKATSPLSYDEMLFAYAIHKALDLAVIYLKENVCTDAFTIDCYDITKNVLNASDSNSYNFTRDFAREITNIITERYSVILG